MIITIARYFKWSPKQIDELYCDDYDFFGLVFWYNDAKEQNKKANELIAKNKK